MCVCVWEGGREEGGGGRGRRGKRPTLAISILANPFLDLVCVVVGPRGVGSPKFRAFFLSPASIFALFVSLWVSSGSKGLADPPSLPHSSPPPPSAMAHFGQMRLENTLSHEVHVTHHQGVTKTTRSQCMLSHVVQLARVGVRVIVLVVDVVCLMLVLSARVVVQAVDIQFS